MSLTAFDKERAVRQLRVVQPDGFEQSDQAAMVLGTIDAGVLENLDIAGADSVSVAQDIDATGIDFITARLRIVGRAPTPGRLITLPGSQLQDSGPTNDRFRIDDGENPEVEFEFDSDSSVVETPTVRQIVFSATDPIEVVTASVIEAINNAPALNVTAALGGDSDQVALTLDNPLTGNMSLTDLVVDVNFKTQISVWTVQLRYGSAFAGRVDRKITPNIDTGDLVDMKINVSKAVGVDTFVALIFLGPG